MTAPERSVTITGVGVATGDAVVSMTPTWETSGPAPQLTVVLSDSDRRLQDSLLMFGGQPGGQKTALGDLITARYAGTDWVATALEPGRNPAVTFEHYIAAQMRSATGPFSSAANVPRARVAQSLITLKGKASWDVEIPEADGKAPPIMDSTVVTRSEATKAQRDKKRAPGFSANASFTINTHTAKLAQKRVLATALSVCDGRKKTCGPKARLALVMALIVESECKNIGFGDASSKGVLQVLASTAKSIGVDPMDVEAVCREFLTNGFGKFRSLGAAELERKHPGWSAGQIAQACQQSAHPGRYDGVANEARRIVAAWSSGDGSLTDEIEEAKATFQVSADQNFWEVSGTLASDVNRLRFIGQDPDGEALFWVAQTTVAQSRPYVSITRADDWAIVTPGTIDELRNIEKLSVQLRVPWDQAGVLIGRAIEVDGFGVYSGTYISTKATAGKDSRWVAVELERPRNPLKRTLSQTGSVSSPSTGLGVTSATATGSVPEKVQRVKTFIDNYTAKKTKYLWGGGHGSFAGPYDCSGWCSAVGHAAGIVSTPMATGAFSTWGTAGQGEYLTFWVREIPGSPRTSHMFGTIKENGRLRVFEAGGISGAFTGWRGSESPAPRSGFQPRHAAGW